MNIATPFTGPKRPPEDRSRFMKRPQKDKDGLKVNREIRAAQIRVIDEEGNMLGVMTVNEGVKLAEERGLDLLEISPTANPPTCKIMDYGKWKYENKKKAAASRKNQVIVQTKEIQIRPRTDQHDIETKVKHARRFILDGDKVKVTLRYSGREMAHQEVGMAVLKKVIEMMNDLVLIESSPKMEGKQMFLLMGPDPVKVKEYLKAHPKKAKEEKEEKLTPLTDQGPQSDDE